MGDADAADPAVAALLAWASSAGAELNVVARGRQLVAARDCAAGEPLLRLPSALLLHAHAPAGDADGALSAALAAVADAGCGDLSLLALRLAVERAAGADSAWAAYFAALPAAFTDPLWWPAEAAAALAQTPLGGAVRLLLRRPGAAPASLPPRAPSAQVAEQAAEAAALAAVHGPALLAALPPARRTPALAAALRDARALRYARSAVASRAFTVACAEGGCCAALLPVADLLDHLPVGGCEWAPDGAAAPAARGAAGLVVLRRGPSAAGEALGLNYGARSNTQLLLSYGFCLHPNPHDSFAVALAAECEAERAGGARQELGRRLRLSRRAQLTRESPLPPPLLSSLRLMLAPEAHCAAALEALDALEEADGEADPPAEELLPACPRTEARAIAALRAALQAALARAHFPGDAAALSQAGCAAAGAGWDAAARAWGGARADWCLSAFRFGQAEVLRAALRALDAQALRGVVLPAEAAAAAEEAEAGQCAAFARWLQAAGARAAPQLCPDSLAASAAVWRQAGAVGCPPLRLRAAPPATPEADDRLLLALPPALLLTPSAEAMAAAGGDEEMALAWCLLRERNAGDASPLAPLARALARCAPPRAALRGAATALAGTTAGGAAEAEAAEAEERVLEFLEALWGGGVEAEEADAFWALAAVRHFAVRFGPGAAEAAPGLALGPGLHALACGGRAELLGSLLLLSRNADGWAELRAVAPVSALGAGRALRLPLAGACAATLLVGCAQPAALLAGEGGPACHSFELLLSPPGSDEPARAKAALLAALALGGAQYLRMPPPAAEALPRCGVMDALGVCLSDFGPGSVEGAAMRVGAAALQRASAAAARAEEALEASEGASVYVPPAARAWAEAEAAAAAARLRAARAAFRAQLRAPANRRRGLTAMAGLLGEVADELGAEVAAGEGVFAEAAAAHRAAQLAIVARWALAAEALLEKEKAATAKRLRQ